LATRVLSSFEYSANDISLSSALSICSLKEDGLLPFIVLTFQDEIL
jgi:hypothetical protein